MYQVNFLPWRHQRITRRKWQCLIILIMQSSCALLMMIYCYFQQQSQQQYLQTTKTQLEQQLMLNQQQIDTIKQQQAQLELWLSHQQRLDEDSQNNLRQLDILKQLSVITPTKSWLTHVVLTNKHLNITAYSYDFQDISQLINQIENNPLLHQTQLIKMGKTRQVNYLHVSANISEEGYEQ